MPMIRLTPVEDLWLRKYCAVTGLSADKVMQKALRKHFKLPEVQQEALCEYLYDHCPELIPEPEAEG